MFQSHVKNTLSFLTIFFVFIVHKAFTNDCLLIDDARLQAYNNMTEKVVELLDESQQTMLTRVKIADDDNERSAGYQYICHKQVTHPVLFVFDNERVPQFHMHNVNISLWIYFFNKDGQLVTKHLMSPYSTDHRPLYSPEAASLYALEVPVELFEQNPIWATIDKINITH